MRRVWIVAIVLGVIAVGFFVAPLLTGSRIREPLILTKTDALSLASVAERGIVPFDTEVAGSALAGEVANEGYPRLRAELRYLALFVRQVKVRRDGDTRTVEGWLSDGQFKSFRFDASEVRLLMKSEPSAGHID